MTLSIFLLGIASSLVAELISWVNVHLLASTPFKGQAAWWIAALCAIVAGFVQEFYFSGVTVVSLSGFFTACVTAFGISQGWFGTIATWLKTYFQVQVPQQ